MNTANHKSLRDFMTPKQREAMQGLPTYHSICLEKTKVARPGKTARNKAKRDRVK